MKNNDPDFVIRLNKLIEQFGGVSAASKIFKVPVSTLSRFKNGQNDPTRLKLYLMAQGSGVDLNWLISGEGTPELESENVNIPVYDVQLSAGHGDITERISTIDHVPFTPNFLLTRTGRADGKGLAIFEARGDSMEPTIEDGDLVMVDLNDCHHRDGIFAFSHNNQARIKRLQYTFGGTNIVSDNKDNYDAELIVGEQMNDLQIIGRVIWRMGKL